MQQAQLLSQKTKPSSRQLTVTGKVLSALLSHDNTQVIWQIELPNGDIYPQIFTIAEFSAFVGVKALLPIKVMDDGLHAYVGKDVTLIIKDFKDHIPPPPPEPV